MTKDQTPKALPHEPDANGCSPELSEVEGEEHMLKQTSWYADLKAKNSIVERPFTVAYGPLHWEIGMLEAGRFQATCHLLSNARLQVEGDSGDELHGLIRTMMVRWLQLAPLP